MSRTLRTRSRRALTVLVSGLLVSLSACADKPDADAMAPDTPPAEPDANDSESSPAPPAGVRLAHIKRSGADEVEIYLANDDGFYVGASRPALRVGERVFVLSRHPASGDLQTLIFPIPQKTFLDLAGDAPVYFASREADLAPGRAPGFTHDAKPGQQAEGTWFLGRLDKASIQTAPTTDGADGEGDNR